MLNSILNSLSDYTIWHQLDNQAKEALTEAIAVGIANHDPWLYTTKGDYPLVDDLDKQYLCFCGNNRALLFWDNTVRQFYYFDEENDLTYVHNVVKWMEAPQ